MLLETKGELRFANQPYRLRAFIGSDAAMARQPYLTVVKDPKGGMIDVGTRSIGQRPDIESRIGNCLMAWPHIEAEMAVVFAQLIGGDNVAALAVFQTIRR